MPDGRIAHVRVSLFELHESRTALQWSKLIGAYISTLPPNRDCINNKYMNWELVFKQSRTGHYTALSTGYGLCYDQNYY